MKHLFVVNIALILSITFLSLSCKGGHKEKENVVVEQSAEEQKVEAISDFINKNFVPLDEFKDLMQLFQDLWSNPSISSDGVFDLCFKNVDDELSYLGFNVKRDKDDPFVIIGTRECEIDKDNYYYSIKSETSDSLKAAYIFRAIGDVCVVGEIILPNEDIYNGMLEKIKAAGYIWDGDNVDFCDGDKESPLYEEQYRKGLYYYTCSKVRLTVALNYDWDKAQRIE